MELSIDTSTRYAGIGLSERGRPLSELSWRSDRNHSVELAPAIRELLRRSRVDISGLRAIFVAAGPGGFSALRVGMSTAKSLATALRTPLVAVNTLDVEAFPYLGLGGPVIALIGAGRRRLYAGSYGLAAQPEYAVVERDDLSSKIQGSPIICGEAALDAVPSLRERIGGGARLVSSPPPTRRAGVLAEIAYRRWQSGHVDDPGSLQPTYLRSSQIEAADRARARKTPS